jgi:hypothetical protein
MLIPLTIGQLFRRPTPKVSGRTFASQKKDRVAAVAAALGPPSAGEETGFSRISDSIPSNSAA